MDCAQQEINALHGVNFENGSVLLWLDFIIIQATVMEKTLKL